VEHVRELLESIGLEGERLRMVNVSSAMGRQFAEEAEDLTRVVQDLGPNPLRNGSPAPKAEGAGT
jgi:coenzyme F420-reducing hydrogenase delta subunit